MIHTQDSEAIGNLLMVGSSMSQDLGLYMHIPFCRKRCHFCAFYLTIYNEGLVQDFLQSVRQEIKIYSQLFQESELPVRTLYFGGGTPTALPSTQLASLITELKSHFSFLPEMEITVEADPATVNTGSLALLYESGVNRISFGSQSHEGTEWKQLGRLGSTNLIALSMQQARDVGFTNLNIDLMYGLPGQTLQSWKHSLEQAVALHPTHVSCYALTIEEGTRFDIDQQRGVLEKNNVRVEVEMSEYAIAFLKTVGYDQYEVSNFSQPGYECHHNLRYWSGLDYLGFGPSAQSYVRGVRFGNVGNLEIYNDSLNARNLPIDETDTLTNDKRQRERVVFGLRMNKGVPIHDFKDLNADPEWRLSVQQLTNLGILCEENQYLKVTSNGRQYLDHVATQLL